MRFYLSFIMCLLISTCFSQDYIYQNQKSYKSTPTFDFTLSDFSIGSDKGIPIQIGKSGNAGVILITANSESGRSYISGPIMIYLQNGKVLRLETRMFTDYIDDHTLALFSINSAYIADLRKSDIIRIRFNYVDSYGNKKGLSAGPESQYGVINNDLDKETWLNITTELQELPHLLIVCLIRKGPDSRSCPVLLTNHNKTALY